MRRLSDEEFKATHVPEPEPVDLDMAPPFDFWEYFEAIPPEHFGGHDFSEGRVPHAWNMPGTALQHVLVECETPNVFLVLVLDVPGGSVAGHHLLDLNRLYGLT
ncbi:hypothetical protein Acy02nite_71660 [Actinoplanes cyaneus]|uniref:Uncharacterized protein n=1 Tax=Actinoplanes cyaneus TaxID=52696 RepID=A0A919INF1_9ACTN|nr:hypothetical protein [Actinoplanes cyaneus]MCW2142266.1 hypothetical protein [Actinoplanes cyaneus]GID69285.1 hypothetical protein Acy02nite_71660 [Actinoplanes cyaneus]